MPRLTNSLPKFRKHRASGQAIVSLCGKDHYLGRCGTKASEREYDRAELERSYRARAGFRNSVSVF